MKILKFIREKRGETQQTVASAVGITQQAYANYEANKREPDNNMLLKLADYFQVSTDYLLGRTDDPAPPKTVYNLPPTFPLCNIPLSAGTGIWLSEGHDYELMQFENTSPDADLAFTIRGDSMEPMYCDNDIVFVKSGVIVESGQVGVFCLNGEGYLKMLQGNKLVSLNKAYDPIVIEEWDSFYCAGRVVGKV